MRTERGVLVGALLLLACARELAGPLEIDTVDAVLDERMSYWTAIETLEAQRDSARHAVRERSAPAGSRQRYVLAMLEEHLDNPRRYARWQKAVADAATGPRALIGPRYDSEALSGLRSNRHAYFWAERLLYPLGGSLTQVAADQLLAIHSETAIEGLVQAASSKMHPAVLERTTRGLARLGEGAALVRILAARRALGDTEWNPLILAASEDLPTEERTRTERILLAQVDKKLSGTPQQLATIELLGVIGGEATLGALIELRKQVSTNERDREVRNALDQAISAVLERTGRLKIPQDATQPDAQAQQRLEEAYEREWQKEYGGLN